MNPQEKPLGSLLKERRLSLGKSIDQISALTKIHSRILEGLEEENFKELPARTFTRGFLVNYLKALGLSENEVLRDFNGYLEDRFKERPEKDHGHQGYAFEGKELEQNRKLMTISLSVAAVFAVVVLLFFKPANHKRKHKHEDIQKTEEEALHAKAAQEAELAQVKPNIEVPIATPVASNLATPVPVGSSVATVTSTATPKPTTTPSPSLTLTSKPDPLRKGDDLETATYRGSFQALEDTYVRYSSDQKESGVLILRKGRYLTLKGNEKITLEIEDPSKIKVKLGGEGGYRTVKGNLVSLPEGSTANAAGPALPKGTPPAAPSPSPSASPSE